MQSRILGRPQRSEKDWEHLTTAEKVAAVSLRHDMPSRNFDLKVTFTDGTTTILRARARDVLSAIAVASVTPGRTWPPDRLTSIISISWEPTSPIPKNFAT